MSPVITPVQPGTGLGPVQAARDETADFAYQEQGRYKCMLLGPGRTK